MKNAKPIQAGGLYLDRAGHWQSATLTTDGRDLLEIGDSVETVSPLIPQCELLGLNAEQGVDMPLDPTGIANDHGVSVVSDLRQSDMAFGGRGGPLTPFYLHALARHMNETAPLVFLELGEIASVTWVDPTVAAPEDPAAILSFEAGPAMSIINRLYNARPDGDFTSGRVEDGALELFLQDPYFRRVAPKWLEADSFENMVSLVYELSDADAEATLCGMIATAILLASEHYAKPPVKCIYSGLASDHSYLINIIKSGLDVPMIPAQGWGLNTSTFRAQTTAYLAARALHGLPTTSPTTTGVRAAIGGATICHPMA